MLVEDLVFVGRARERGPYGSAPERKRLHLVFPASETSVRTALLSARRTLCSMGIGPDAASVVELVFAEALNNIVEHAYGKLGPGIIELAARLDGHSLAVRVIDDGMPMPGGSVPPGQTHDLEVPIDRLPEGGFGWGMIRDLTDDLSYRRDGARNELRFTVDLDSFDGID